MGGLIGYQVAHSRVTGQPEGALYDYVMAENGIFLRARSERIEATMLVAPAETPIRGLAKARPEFGLRAPRVPADLLLAILERASEEADLGREVLFHLNHSPLCPTASGWLLDEPAQTQSETACRPLEDGPGSTHDRALIEVHSHHRMPARFSPQDDRDETGFRFYVVIGNYPDWRINVRLGVYGQFWRVPAELLFESEGLIEDWYPEVAPDARWFAGVILEREEEEIYA